MLGCAEGCAEWVRIQVGVNDVPINLHSPIRAKAYTTGGISDFVEVWWGLVHRGWCVSQTAARPTDGKRSAYEHQCRLISQVTSAAKTPRQPTN